MLPQAIAMDSVEAHLLAIGVVFIVITRIRRKRFATRAAPVLPPSASQNSAETPLATFGGKQEGDAAERSETGPPPIDPSRPPDAPGHQ